MLDGRVVTTLLAQTRELMHAESAWLYLADGDALLRASTSAMELAGQSSGEDADVVPVPVPGDASGDDQALHRAAHDAGRPVLVSPATTVAGRRGLLGDRSAIAAPLVGSAGALGTLVVADRSGDIRGFDQRDMRLFATLASHASVALENNRLVYRLRDRPATRR